MLAIFVVFLIELIFYKEQNRLFQIVVKPLNGLFLALLAYSKAALPLSKVSRLLLLAIFCSILGDYIYIFEGSSFRNFLLIVIYIVQHQLLILLFKEEGVRFSQLFSPKYWLPGLLVLAYAYFFFGYAFLDSMEAIYFFLVFPYVVQLCILVLMSFMRSRKQEGYFIVLSGCLLIMLSDSLTSTAIFIGTDAINAALVRVVYGCSQLFLVLGLLPLLSLPDMERI